MLKKFGWFVVKARYLIILTALVLFVFGAYGAANLDVNYDIFTYLPQELNSVKGFKILTDEFNSGSIIEVAIDNADQAEMLKLIKKLESLDGVEKVDWLTSFLDETQPIELLDKELIDRYYADGTTVMRISLKGKSTDPKTEQTYEEVLSILKDYNAYISGSIATNHDMQSIIESDMLKYSLAAVVLVTIVLLLILPSIVVPFLFILTIGFAAILNLGLSYYLGEQISYFGRVVVLPLQFAVTMDYALFLFHRYEEERRTLPIDEAMADAIATTFKSISTASLTTIAGFLALSAMRLGFGADIGFTLARGVFITLISIVTLLPALLLTFDRAIHKISHRIFIPDFGTIGNFIRRWYRVIVPVFFILLAVSIYLYSQVKISFDFQAGMPENMPSIKAENYIAEKFNRKETAFLIFENPDEIKLRQVLGEIENIDGVTDVFGYSTVKDPLLPDEFVPEDLKKQFESGKYTYYSVELKYSSSDPRTKKIVAAIKKAISECDTPVYLTGEAPMLEDMRQITVEDVDRVNWISLAAIFVILLFAFRSITVPLALVGSIELAILFNQGLYALSGAEMIFIAALAIGAIQLGSTVDYAVLLSTRYEEELKKTGNRFEAIVKAVKESTRPILTSAATMFGATIGMAVLSTIGTVKSLGMLISRGALISFFTVIFIMPALLVGFQKLFEYTSINWPREGKK